MEWKENQSTKVDLKTRNKWNEKETITSKLIEKYEKNGMRKPTYQSWSKNKKKMEWEGNQYIKTDLKIRKWDEEKTSIPKLTYKQEKGNENKSSIPKLIEK